jgi:hypothetical protein
MGSNMQAGKIYSVNETGVNGEYFIPRVNGYMSNPQGSGGGGGSPVYIDARTTVDARGATQDAILELDRRLSIREERLRKELPYLIDSRVTDSSRRGRY